MTVQTAAKELYKTLPFPLGTANVLAVEDGKGARLIVWVEPSLVYKARTSLPDIFEGYRLQIEARPSAGSEQECH